MTFAFLVRRGFLKVIGSVVSAALARGHRVVLLWDPHETKPGEGVTEDELRRWWPDARLGVYGRGPLLPVLSTYGAHALVAPSLHYLLQAYGRESELGALRAAGVRCYSLDYLLETLTSDPSGYEVIDTTFYTSEFQRQLHWEIARDGFAAVGVDRYARTAVCGSTLMDQMALVDRTAVRRRYGIPEGRPVVVLMSLKMAVEDGGRRWLLWGPGSWRPDALKRRLGLARRALRSRALRPWGWLLASVWPPPLRPSWYRAVCTAVARLCRREGAVLVVKSRQKNDDPAFLRGLADVFLYDEAVYPYTSLELLAIADLCVHFQSGTALEAAFASVPTLNIAVSQRHLTHHASERALDEVYGGRPGSLLNFPGVVWMVEPGDAVAYLGRTSLADFPLDPVARREYIAKFLGFDDTESGARVLETIERQATS